MGLLFATMLHLPSRRLRDEPDAGSQYGWSKSLQKHWHTPRPIVRCTHISGAERRPSAGDASDKERGP